jgi:hypothetical protein
MEKQQPMSTNLYNSIPEEFRMYVQEPLEDSHLTKRAYTLRITNEMEHSRGIAWTGELRTGDSPVAIVENAGHGGCNDYIVVDEGKWETFATDAYVAYGNRGESKDSLIQFIDVLGAMVTS